MARNRETGWLQAWYGESRWTLWLLPLAILYRLLSAVRRFILQRFVRQRLPVPVVVVGNITVGGTGKTPLLIALVKHLQQQGLQPGVVSRGYGGKSSHWPLEITSGARVEETGDEPMIIFQQTGCAVCVGPDRVASARRLIARGCNIILSDDGLQHYRLGRDLEIAVIDGTRGFGNGYPLPVGPLREPVSRLDKVAMIVVNGGEKPAGTLADRHHYRMQMQPAWLERVGNGERLSLDHLPAGSRVDAVAGIGNPDRFFATLTRLQWQPVPHSFPDHHRYGAGDFHFAGSLPLVMTTKDAVKCRPFAAGDWYAVQVEAAMSDDFFPAFDQLIKPLLPTSVTNVDSQ